MSTENPNSAGTTSALAQKTGIKPLAKIIAGVCAAIAVVVALCSIFGDSAGVAAVKNSVWNYDDTVTFENALSAYCEKKTREDGKGKNYFEDAKEFQEKASFWDGFKTPSNMTFFSNRLKKSAYRCVEAANNAKLVPVWEEGELTSTGVRKVKLTLMWEGDRWIESYDKNLDGETLAAFHLPDGRNFYRVKYEQIYRAGYEQEDFTIGFLIYPDGSIRAADEISKYHMEVRIYGGF